MESGIERGLSSVRIIGLDAFPVKNGWDCDTGEFLSGYVVRHEGERRTLSVDDRGSTRCHRRVLVA
jgi:hypothetical protein